MDSRKQFEEWASDNGEWPQAIERNGEGYKFMKTHTDWLAWQASRAAICIELQALPEPACDAHEYAGSYWPDMWSGHQLIAYTKQVIHAAGVRTK